MSATFEIIIRVVLFFGVALYMGSGSSSLVKIAKDLGRIADRPGPKPRGEDPERPIDT